MNAKINITDIVSSALCSACGSCAGICPLRAIRMVETPSKYLVPQIDGTLCSGCKKCLAVCPSNPENEIDDRPENMMYGDFICGYAAYAIDRELYDASQTGGCVTALLCYLLETGRIDGAVVNRFSPETRRPEAFYADTKDLLASGCGSYYTQSAVNREILRHSNKRVAAVVLGCQAESLKLISRTQVGVKLPDYTIGLVCAGTNAGGMIDDLIAQSGCQPQKETVCGFRFRDKAQGGWPGNVSVATDQQTYTIPSRARHALKPVYEAYRCLLCYDQMNIFADVVCGDPWGLLSYQAEPVHTVLIARTEKGRQLLLDAQAAGVIHLDEISVSDIMKGQTVDDRHAAKVRACYEISKEMGWCYPYPRCYSNASVDRKTYNKYRERMQYTRTLFLATDKSSADALVRKRKASLNRGAIGKSVLGVIKQSLHKLKQA